MSFSCLTLFLACFACCEAAVLRGKSESLSVQLEESSEWAGLSEAAQAEAEDRSFLLNQLDQTETQLKQLQQFAASLQAPAAPTEKKTTKTASKAVEPKKASPPVADKKAAVQ